jgi:hypothetical protein
LERIGVDVKVRNSGIKIDGTTRAGDEIDKIILDITFLFMMISKLRMD